MANQCGTCKKSFSRPDALKRHRCGQASNKINCNDCGKSFSRRDSFIRHQKSCGKKLSRKNHEKKKCVGKEHSTIKCDDCGKSFSRRDSFIRHQKSCGKKLSCKNHEKKKCVEKEHSTIKCDDCGKSFSRRDSFIRHQNSCGKKLSPKNHESKCQVKETFLCEVCGGVFPSQQALNLHKRRQHNPKIHKCEHCDQAFSNKRHLYRHVRYRHTQPNFECQECGRGFRTRRFFQRHAQRHAMPKKDAIVIPPGFERRESCFNNYMVRFVKKVENPDEKTDLIEFLTENRPLFKNLLSNVFDQMKQFKFIPCVQVSLAKNITEADGTITTDRKDAFFNTNPLIVTHPDLLEHIFDQMDVELASKLEKYQQDGSDWYITGIHQFDVHVVLYRPIRGGSEVKLDKFLSGKGCVTNVNAPDERCFLYSVLASLHPDVVHPENFQSYEPYEKEIQWDEYPMSLSSIPRFERLNDIRILLYGYENGTVFPLYVGENNHGKEVYLLMLKDKHFCSIHNFNRLLGSDGKHRQFCPYCCQNLYYPDKLEAHKVMCREHKIQRVEMPPPGSVTKFTNIDRQLPVPYVVYADFECILKKIQTCKPDPSSSYHHPYQMHVPCGVGYVMVGWDGEIVKDFHKVYRGADCVDVFLKDMERASEWVKKKLADDSLPLSLSKEEKNHFKNSTICHICNESLTPNDKVRDHCHVFKNVGPLGGSYRGAAHNKCNQLYRLKSTLPIFFHNLKNYDQHLIMQAVSRFGPKQVSVLAQTSERYISVRVNNMQFLDSLNFLGESLEKLASRLTTFKILPKIFDHDLDLLKQKGIFPYEHISDWDVFEETKLPPSEAFYSSLTEEAISEEEYKHAERVWKAFKCVNLGMYHDLYLSLDVALLADIFQEFRKMCISYYNLDPAHYVSVPSFSWDAALKFSKVKLELIDDIDIYNFFEGGIRGGVAFISRRYARANPPEFPEIFDPSQPPSQNINLDCCNLYGWAMQCLLPYGGFRWVDASLEEILATDDEADEGYVVECDLEYPQHLHDEHADYPLAPEKFTVTQQLKSSYISDIPSPSSVKLIPTLYDKKNYIVHYRTLKYYAELGLRVTKIHRTLKFKQAPWLKSYIDFNSEKRKNCKDSFGKNLFKLMNNSVYGKTLESVRKRTNIQITTNRKRIEKLASKPSMKSFKSLGDRLAIFQMLKVKLVLDKPIYVGFSILDISKFKMYSFHYGFIKKVFPESILLMTDTDSLVYHIPNSDRVYSIIKENLHMFDTSEFPQWHPCHSFANAAVPGTFKDELKGWCLLEFVGLRAKMYSFIYITQLDHAFHEKKVGKGIKKNVLNNTLTHDSYKKTLENKTITRVRMRMIRSTDHKIFTIEINKIGLSFNDDKRYVMGDGVQTLPYGHYSLII